MRNAPLYARLLGPSWPRVAEPVRFAHTTNATIRARGCFQIAHGLSPVARLLARVLHLPRASDAADTSLVVTSGADGERWIRTFDGRRLDSRQYHVGESVLAERIGMIEFRFQVAASDGSLFFRQLDSAFVCGTVRVRLPSPLAPTVHAREAPAGARRTHVRVRVVLPAFGPLLTYEGTLDFEQAPV